VHLAGIGRRQAEELDALDDRVRRNGPDDLPAAQDLAVVGFRFGFDPPVWLNWADFVPPLAVVYVMFVVDPELCGP
jgi:hypothetical protein